MSEETAATQSTTTEAKPQQQEAEKKKKQTRNNFVQNNIFQQIMKGEKPCKKVFEDGEVFAFNDINPQAPTHVLVIPKQEVYSFDEFVEKNTAEQIGNFFKKVRQIAMSTGCQEDGYRIVMNHGMFAEQIVPHFHVHILGGRVLGGMTTVPDHQIDQGPHPGQHSIGAKNEPTAAPAKKDEDKKQESGCSCAIA